MCYCVAGKFSKMEQHEVWKLETANWTLEILNPWRVDTNLWFDKYWTPEKMRPCKWTCRDLPSNGEYITSQTQCMVNSIRVY